MTIQERILQYIDNKDITPYKFCKDLDFPMGYLSKRGAIRTDNYLKIIKYYTDINPEWLLTGEGSMLKEEEEKNIVSQALPAANDEVSTLLREKAAMLEAIIKEKEEKEVMYKEKIMALENELQKYKNLSQPSRAVASGTTQYSTARV